MRETAVHVASNQLEHEISYHCNQLYLSLCQILKTHCCKVSIDVGGQEMWEKHFSNSNVSTGIVMQFCMPVLKQSLLPTSIE